MKPPGAAIWDQPANGLGKRLADSPLLRGGLTLVAGVLAGNLLGFGRVAVTAYLLVNRPWENKKYQECVRMGQDQLGSDVSKSTIQTYCHQLYG